MAVSVSDLSSEWPQHFQEVAFMHLLGYDSLMHVLDDDIFKCAMEF